MRGPSDWQKGGAREARPFFVKYEFRLPDGRVFRNTMEVWTKQGKDGAVERIKGLLKRKWPTASIQKMKVFETGRTPAGLYVPKGKEDLDELG